MSGHGIGTDCLLPGITHWQHPSFFAYFPSIASFESLLGDIYAGAVSNPGFNVSEGLIRRRILMNFKWACSPASTELEAIVMDWSAKLLGLDNKFHTASGVGGGVLQVGPYMSCMMTVVIPPRLLHLMHLCLHLLCLVLAIKGYIPTFQWRS